MALGAHHQGRVNSETDQLIILTQVLFEHGDYDYYDFFNSFNGEGFSLLINMAQVRKKFLLIFYHFLLVQGGVMPGTHDTFVDGQPQFMKISSVKVYGF